VCSWSYSGYVKPLGGFVWGCIFHWQHSSYTLQAARARAHTHTQVVNSGALFIFSPYKDTHAHAHAHARARARALTHTHTGVYTTGSANHIPNKPQLAYGWACSWREARRQLGPTPAAPLHRRYLCVCVCIHTHTDIHIHIHTDIHMYIFTVHI